MRLASAATRSGSQVLTHITMRDRVSLPTASRTPPADLIGVEDGDDERLARSDYFCNGCDRPRAGLGDGRKRRLIDVVSEYFEARLRQTPRAGGAH
jgi:hypothetical protein